MVILFSLTLFRYYNSSAKAFLDLVDVPSCDDPTAQRLRLRVGSRKLDPPARGIAPASYFLRARRVPIDVALPRSWVDLDPLQPRIGLRGAISTTPFLNPPSSTSMTCRHSSPNSESERQI
jgi:hypothetical protein